MTDPTYYALTGDIVASRDLSDRADVQRRLRATVDALNRELTGAIAAPLKVVAGDEVQGLLHEPEAAVDVVARIADALHPVAMMWGIGRGPLSTDLSEDVSVVDGPCLHRAREAVEAAAADDRWVVAAGFDPPHGAVLSALFRTTWELRSAWTETQMRYVREARSRNQTEVAKLFDVSKQAVSKALDAASFAAVREGEEAARRLLRWLARPDVPDRRARTGTDASRAGS